MATSGYKMCGFGEAIRKGYSQYAVYRGRATRSEFWWFTMFCGIVGYIVGLAIQPLSFGISLISEINHSSPEVQLLVLIPVILAEMAFLFFACTLPSISVSVRRLHDIGKSGWHYWLYLIPIYGMVLFIKYGCRDSQPGTNAYGPSEKYPD